MLIYPAAFNMTTGPMHWELLQRARANDLQLFVATISPARDTTAEYIAWGNDFFGFFFSKKLYFYCSFVGHSTIVDPWGKVINSASECEETVVADLGIF